MTSASGPSLRRPRALPPGGTIGVLSPASASDAESLTAGIAILESRGYTVRLAPHALDRNGHMAGTDADRASDFAAFYADPEIDVLWCARGGSSSCRLWPRLDWAALAALPPKMLVGYSDITSLHIPINQKLGAVSLHGPVIFEVGLRLSPELLDWELCLLTDPVPMGIVPGRRAETLVPGVAEGPLCGGCLSLIAATVGTPYEIDAHGKIILLEDIHSRPWQIERDLWQMREAGILETAAGFLVGEATDCDDTHTQPIRQVWSEILAPFGKPTVLGFPFGHVPDNHALPLGVRAHLDADSGTLTLLESAVH